MTAKLAKGYAESSKSPDSAATAHPRSATKSVGSATSDSLLELAANGGAANVSPSCGKRPARAAAYRGVALRRFRAQRQLNSLDDDDLFVDNDSNGSPPGTKMAKMTVKDEANDAGKENASDYGPDPWGGVPAPDPWTKPRSQQDVADASDIYRPNRSLVGPKGGDDDNVGPSSSSKPVKTEKKLGVVGSLLAECFDSQSHYKRATLPGKRIKSEPGSDEGSANNGPAVGKQRKRRLGQQTATSTKGRKVEVVTLSSDEDKVPRRRAKKPKKHEKDTVIYVLSSDSDDQLDP